MQKGKSALGGRPSDVTHEPAGRGRVREWKALVWGGVIFEVGWLSFPARAKTRKKPITPDGIKGLPC